MSGEVIQAVKDRFFTDESRTLIEPVFERQEEAIYERHRLHCETCFSSSVTNSTLEWFINKKEVVLHKLEISFRLNFNAPDVTDMFPNMAQRLLKCVRLKYRRNTIAEYKQLDEDVRFFLWNTKDERDMLTRANYGGRDYQDGSGTDFAGLQNLVCTVDLPGPWRDSPMMTGLMDEPMCVEVDFGDFGDMQGSNDAQSTVLSVYEPELHGYFSRMSESRLEVARNAPFIHYSLPYAHYERHRWLTSDPLSTIKKTIKLSNYHGLVHNVFIIMRRTLNTNVNREQQNLEQFFNWQIVADRRPVTGEHPLNGIQNRTKYRSQFFKGTADTPEYNVHAYTWGLSGLFPGSGCHNFEDYRHVDLEITMESAIASDMTIDVIWQKLDVLTQTRDGELFKQIGA